jgi:hypothetical protein
MKPFVYKEPSDNRDNETVWKDLKKRTEDKCGYPDPITFDDTRIVTAQLWIFSFTHPSLLLWLE